MLQTNLDTLLFCNNLRFLNTDPVLQKFVAVFQSHFSLKVLALPQNKLSHSITHRSTFLWSKWTQVVPQNASFGHLFCRVFFFFLLYWAAAPHSLTHGGGMVRPLTISPELRKEDSFAVSTCCLWRLRFQLFEVVGCIVCLLPPQLYNVLAYPEKPDQSRQSVSADPRKKCAKWAQCHRIRLRNRRSPVRIPPGCKVFGTLCTAMLLNVTLFVILVCVLKRNKCKRNLFDLLCRYKKRIAWKFCIMLCTL
jgi:hypothetical protein